MSTPEQAFRYGVARYCKQASLDADDHNELTRMLLQPKAEMLPIALKAAGVETEAAFVKGAQAAAPMEKPAFLATALAVGSVLAPMAYNYLWGSKNEAAAPNEEGMTNIITNPGGGQPPSNVQAWLDSSAGKSWAQSRGMSGSTGDSGDSGASGGFGYNPTSSGGTNQPTAADYEKQFGANFASTMGGGDPTNVYEGLNKFQTASGQGRTQRQFFRTGLRRMGISGNSLLRGGKGFSGEHINVAAMPEGYRKFTQSLKDYGAKQQQIHQGLFGGGPSSRIGGGFGVNSSPTQQGGGSNASAGMAGGAAGQQGEQGVAGQPGPEAWGGPTGANSAPQIGGDMTARGSGSTPVPGETQAQAGYRVATAGADAAFAKARATPGAVTGGGSPGADAGGPRGSGGKATDSAPGVSLLSGPNARVNTHRGKL